MWRVLAGDGKQTIPGCGPPALTLLGPNRVPNTVAGRSLGDQVLGWLAAWLLMTPERIIREGNAQRRGRSPTVHWREPFTRWDGTRSEHRLAHQFPGPLQESTAKWLAANHRSGFSHSPGAEPVPSGGPERESAPFWASGGLLAILRDP